MGNGAIVFVEPGQSVELAELAQAEFVIGVYPAGNGLVLKDRYGPSDRLSAECVTWLRANPTNRPVDWREAEV